MNDETIKFKILYNIIIIMVMMFYSSATVIDSIQI